MLYTAYIEFDTNRTETLFSSLLLCCIVRGIELRVCSIWYIAYCIECAFVNGCSGLVCMQLQAQCEAIRMAHVYQQNKNLLKLSDKLVSRI